MQTRRIPTVSVVMPAYNAEKYLREAIDSMLGQTYDDFEFIIINDGSTDGTKEIILRYSDPRIVYIENEKNSGICITLNKGLDVARGRYIARMDSDDIALPERLAVQVDYMDKNPHIGACGSDIEIFGEGTEPHIFSQLHSPEECAAGLLFNSCFAHPSVIIRKDIIDNHRLRYKDEYRGLEDYELWWQISKYSRLNNIARPLLRYRQHKTQETRNVTKDVHDAFRKFVNVRFSDMNICASTKEIDLWYAYGIGDYAYFDDEALKEFMILAKRIITKYPKQSFKSISTPAIKLTLSKGITFALCNSCNIKGRRQKYYNAALAAGVFPLSWYLKVTYHNLLR